MTRYLVDTNVISISAPAAAVRRAAILQWMESNSQNLFLSAVSVAASDLAAWLKTVLHLYGDRVLPFDSPTAEIAGGLSDLARGRGHSPGLADIIIAATAKRHGLTVLSRNASHFMPLDVRVIDPFRNFS